MNVADEAELMSAIFVIPRAVVTHRHEDAGLVAAVVVRLTLVPICVRHVVVCDVVCIQFHFPHKRRVSRGVSTLSCRPDYTIQRITASRPNVSYKRSATTLFQLT